MSGDGLGFGARLVFFLPLETAMLELETERLRELTALMERCRDASGCYWGEEGSRAIELEQLLAGYRAFPYDADWLMRPLTAPGWGSVRLPLWSGQPHVPQPSTKGGR